MTHVANVMLCGVVADVVARIVTTILLSWPAWLLTAMVGLLAAAACVVGIACLLVALFVIGLIDAIEHERNEHA